MVFTSLLFNFDRYATRLNNAKKISGLKNVININDLFLILTRYSLLSIKKKFLMLIVFYGFNKNIIYTRHYFYKMYNLGLTAKVIKQIVGGMSILKLDL